MRKKLFTSESVTEGHPDKMCDQISDAILDAFLKDDPESRVACEVAATTGMIFIFGEVSSNAVVDCAKKCEIQISYAIGMSNPVSIYVDTFGTSEYTNEVIEGVIEKVFDLRPDIIIDTLGLKRPIYSNIACYGHVGRTDIDLPWGKIDKIEEINYALFEMIGTGMERGKSRYR